MRGESTVAIEQSKAAERRAQRVKRNSILAEEYAKDAIKLLEEKKYKTAGDLLHDAAQRAHLAADCRGEEQNR